MLKVLKSKKGDGYIDVAVAVLVIALVLILIFSIWSMMTVKQDMTYMANELLEVASVTGRVGDEVEDRFQDLCREMELHPTAMITAEYFDTREGTVQLGDTITVTLSLKMTLPGFAGYELPFGVEVTKSGLSLVYWK